ncbi:MAG TPA: hypothetical protein VKV15_28405 [Bryobacteraceae bacterium]|nr:hypothetical protein [Bryobacteraceae bacterium]
MAAPISLKVKLAEPKEEVRARLAEAPITHARAILSAYELLQEAEDHGVLDLLRGSLGAGGDIVTRLAEAADTPESIRIVRNLVSLGRILASFDPNILHALADELTSQKSWQTPPLKSPGLFRALLRLGSKDSRRVLIASIAFIEAFGRALASGKTIK